MKKKLNDEISAKFTNYNKLSMSLNYINNILNDITLTPMGK